MPPSKDASAPDPPKPVDAVAAQPARRVPPDSFWAFLWWYTRRGGSAIIIPLLILGLATLGFAGAGVWFFRVLGYDLLPAVFSPRKAHEPPVTVETKVVTEPYLGWVPRGDLEKVIEGGQAKGSQEHNVLASAIYMVRIEDSATGSPIIRKTEERSIYTLLNLRDVILTDDAFQERYKNASATNLLRWTGTDQEDDVSGEAPDSKYVEYKVRYAGAGGDVHALATGIDSVQQLPLRDLRTNREMVLRWNEDVATYPNDDDYIGELILIVESKTTHLIKADAFLSRGAPAPRFDVVIPVVTDTIGRSNPDGECTLIARWRNVQPGTTAILKYQW